MGLLQALWLCRSYERMGSKERAAVQKERLEQLVAYARHNSPYYAQKYKNLNEQFSLSDIPTTSKQELMEHWDEWLTDREVHLQDIEQFMKDRKNIGRKWNGKYMVFTTSGSTGNPLVMVCDKTVDNVMSAINVRRAITRKEDKTAFIRRGGSSVGVFADCGFYLGNSSVHARVQKMPWKEKKMGIADALLKTEEIVAILNARKPAMLGGYPSNLELLAEEKEQGRLNIQPVFIMTGGEQLTDELRERLSKVFGCYVQTSYSCTEGGSVACECRCQHFHINDDWSIVEAVDANNQPVEDGKLAEKLLLTNLSNYTQPFIRYEVTDRVIMHHECDCGNPSPWLELEGRTDDVLSFETKQGIKKIPPLAVYAVLKEIHEIRRFQLVACGENRVTLRLETVAGVSREKAFEAARQALTSYLAECGIEKLSVSLADQLPRKNEKSGKFKHIIFEKSDNP